jgi:hypothetical protein
VCGVCGVCGGVGGVGGVGCCRVGSLLTFDIPQTALVTTLDTYDFTFLFFPDNFEVIKSVYFLQNVKKRELLRKTNYNFIKIDLNFLATLASPSLELRILDGRPSSANFSYSCTKLVTTIYLLH